MWLPLFQLGGVAGYLFLPLAEAVIFAMIASFILSRTLTPTMAAYLLRGHAEHDDAEGDGEAPRRRSRNPLKLFQEGFERRFARVRDGYGSMLQLAIDQPRTFIAGFIVIVLLSFGLTPFLGENFFPSIDLVRSSCMFARSREPASRRRRASSIWSNGR